MIDYQSFYQAQLSAGIDDTQTNIPLDNVPIPSEGFLVIEPTVPAKREIIYFTSKDGSSVTVPAGAGLGRGYDGSTATSHLQNADVIMAPIGMMFKEFGAITADSFTVRGSSTANNGWTVGLPTPDTVTNNGNRSYDLVFNGTDLTDTVSEGMRLRMTRTVSAPTYMGGAFNGSSHYFTKVTPTSTLSTFTNNFTMMAWVEPTAYAQAGIMGRADAALNNGAYIQFLATGQVRIGIASGGAANTRAVDTYQSLPLNKKTHIAVSWTSGTVVIYFDGVSVPVTAAVTGGTAPTTAGTGGDFSVGRIGALASNYFTGYISNAAAFDAVLTASTVRSLMSQDIAVGATNCIGSWNLNNTGVNQQAAGTNDLTATGGVSYTVRSPYGNYLGGTLDYAIITKTAFSTNTTLTVQVPEGCTIPTSGGVSAVSYSTQSVPYGFPRAEGRWEIAYINKTDLTTTSNATYGSFSSGAYSLTVPIGGFTVGWKAETNVNTTTSVYFALSSTALTGLTNVQAANVTTLIGRTLSSAASGYTNNINVSDYYQHAAATTYIMYTQGATTGGGIGASVQQAKMYAIPSYL